MQRGRGGIRAGPALREDPPRPAPALIELPAIKAKEWRVPLRTGVLGGACGPGVWGGAFRGRADRLSPSIPSPRPGRPRESRRPGAGGSKPEEARVPPAAQKTEEGRGTQGRGNQEGRG